MNKALLGIAALLIVVLVSCADAQYTPDPVWMHEKPERMGYARHPYYRPIPGPAWMHEKPERMDYRPMRSENTFENTAELEGEFITI